MAHLKIIFMKIFLKQLLYNNPASDFQSEAPD